MNLSLSGLLQLSVLNHSYISLKDAGLLNSMETVTHYPLSTHTFIYIYIFWHEAWKSEEWSQKGRPFLDNCWVKNFRDNAQQGNYIWATVFSIEAAPRIYNEDLRQLENYNWRSLLRRQSKMIQERRHNVSCSCLWSVVTSCISMQ
jgi:hypothetical protein